MSKAYSPWLQLLTGLFIFRVLVQLLVGMINVPFIPAFDQWHSGTMPYGLLLLFQIIIILILVRINKTFKQGIVHPNYKAGALLLSLGLLYMSAMVSRLILGLTIMSNHSWFTHYIPTLFHIVLASYLLLVGHFHYRYGHKVYV